MNTQVLALVLIVLAVFLLTRCANPPVDLAPDQVRAIDKFLERK